MTIVAWQREVLFGEIVDGEMVLNDFGKIVSKKWQWLETQYEYVELGEWVVMPNHFHGILVIDGRGDTRIAPTTQKRKPLVRQAKLGVSCRVQVSAEQGLTNHSYRVLQ